MPESAACILCGADDTELVTDKTRYDTSCTIVKCKKCGLIYMNPRPTEDEVAGFYAGEYRGMYNPTEVPEEFDKRCINIPADRVKIIERAARKHGIQGRKLLDIGTATGNLLRLMREKGWDGTGVEPDARYVNYAREQGLDVLEGTLVNVDLPDEFFDVVTLFHTLEHLVDPIGALNTIRSTLKDKGALLIEVPNVDWLKCRIINKEPLDYHFQPAHIYYFSPKTLKRILNKAGFRVSHIKTWSGYAAEDERGASAVLRRLLASPYSFAATTLTYIDHWIRNRISLGFYITAIARKQLY